MKRLLICLLLLEVMVNAAVRIPLDNADFEKKDKNWNIHDKGEISTIIPEAASHGKYGLRVVDQSTTRGGDVFFATRKPVTAGKVYQLKFRARTATNSGCVAIHWNFYDAKGAHLTSVQRGEMVYHFKATKEWQMFSTQAMAPPTAAFWELRIHTAVAGKGDADLDSFDLFELAEKEAKEYLKNEDVIIHGQRKRDRRSLKIEMEQVEAVMKKAAAMPHPRLFASAEEFEALKKEAEGNGMRRRMRDHLCVLADSLMDVPPVERKLEGRRLLGVSRSAVYRVSTLALSYRLTGNASYLDRCVKELRAIASFSDWNPSHYLDVGEMTLAIATGYDWLYNELTEDDRKSFAEAILRKGIKSSGAGAGWRRASNNWGQVCHTGMLAGAVATADVDFGACLTQAYEDITNMAIPMRAYEPNGNYPEGPGYWEYGTGYNVLGLAIMDHAFGTDFGLSELKGFKETGGYFDYATGPSGIVFNYADGGAGGRSRMGSVWWFAKRFNQPELVEGYERERFEIYCNEKPRQDWFHAYMFFSLFERPEGVESAVSKRPLVWNGGGPVPIVVMRNTWDNEKATYIGLKGGSPGGPHGHMDGGSFVLDAAKVRWACDLGAEGYHRIESMGLNLWSAAQDSDRWKLFRLNNKSHNTLVIDDQPQIVRGFGMFMNITETPACTVMDLTSLYAKDCKSAIRKVELSPEGVVTVTDELTGLKPGVKVVWGFTTQQKVEAYNETSVTLVNGEKRFVTETLNGGEVRVVDVTVPQPEFKGNSMNRNARRVEVVATASEDGKALLRVKMGLK